MSILRGFIGIAVIIGIAFLFSSNKKKINWRQVGIGLLIQLVFAFLILNDKLNEYIPVGQFFEFIGRIFTKVIGFTQEGTNFLFASFGGGEIESPLLNFAIIILPTVIFFSALTSLFYYWGILQKVVWAFAWIMKRLMKLSGAESLAAAGNIFLGQTEA
ncbi:MAG TPA: Na+ dependent nucleoside transporter, partial [Flavobacteriales bacterium]|nr:Na+ dependent nucleoside transporter [Flavobacteriales bacterium]